MSTDSSLGDIADITEREACNHPHCEEYYDVGTGTEPDSAPFCSPTCRRRSIALGIYEDIEHDRRICNNCHRQIRETFEQGRDMGSRKVVSKSWYVNRPDRRYPILTKSPNDPYAYFKEDDNRDDLPKQSVPTKHTQRGAGGRCALSDPHPDTNYQSATDGSEGTICVCGVGHHTTLETPIRSLDRVMDDAKRLVDVLEMLREEGHHDQPVDRELLLSSVENQKRDQYNHDHDRIIFTNAIADALQFDTIEAVDDNHS